MCIFYLKIFSFYSQMILNYLLESSSYVLQLNEIKGTFLCGICCVKLLFDLSFKELDFISKIIDLLLVLCSDALF